MQLQQCYADRHAGTYNCSDSQAVVHRGGRGVVENAKVETTSDGGGGSGVMVVLPDPFQGMVVVSLHDTVLDCDNFSSFTQTSPEISR